MFAIYFYFLINNATRLENTGNTSQYVVSSFSDMNVKLIPIKTLNIIC